MNPSSELFRTRQHFEVLDGMRGVAAIAVVVFHFMEIAVPDYHDSFIAHAYLAVDFFYCLSGFVIAYAYDGRLKDLGVWNFIKLRLIRLHPLVIIGSIIGLIAFVADPFNELWRRYSGKLGLMFGTSMLMIPYPAVRERFFNLFHLNPPAWSLFWEYIANIFYALVLIRLKNWMLSVLLLFSVIWLYYESNQSDFLGVGWSGDNFWGGVPRVTAAFFSGVLLFRLRWVIRTRLGFGLVSVLLLGTFVIPFREIYNYWMDPTIVILAFPLLLALGAGTEARGVMGQICRFFGEISYPLYMVHYPFIWLFMSYVEKYKPSLGTMTLIMVLGTIVLMTLAWVILRWVDAPVRIWLRKKWIRRPQ